MIDFAFMILVCIFGFMGMREGAVKQLGRWVGLLAGYLVAKPLAPLIAPAFVNILEWPLAGSTAVASMACFYGFYVVVGFFARRSLYRRFPDAEGDPLNRLFGFFLAAGKGAVIVCLPISLVLFFEKPIVDYMGGKEPFAIRTSLLVGVLRKHNPIVALPDAIVPKELKAAPALAKLMTLASAARNAPSPEALADDPRLKALLDDPTLKAQLGDDSLMKAIQSGDWEAARKNPQVEELLKDPRIAGQLDGLMNPEVPDVEKLDSPAQQ